MMRSLLSLSMLAALLVCTPPQSVEAKNGSGRSVGHGRSFGHHTTIGRAQSVSHRFKHGHGFGHKFGHGFGFGFGFGGFGDDVWGYADLYRELYNNLPYFALHPPVYYSYPVPRTYGYSPFAYWPHVMTPDPNCHPEPVEIINPHVPQSPEQDAAAEQERSVHRSVQPEPLVIVNPFVAPRDAVVQQ